MTDLQLFSNPEFGDLRAAVETGEIWFLAKDPCEILGTRTDHVRDILDDDEVSTLSQVIGNNHTTVVGPERGGRDPLVVSEPGLYKMIMKSRKPVAKPFQRWVTHEVLPSIRKHGGYIAGQEQMDTEEMLCRALLYCNSKVESLERTVELKNDRIHEQGKLIDAMAPKAALADAVIVTKDDINVADLSAILQQVPGSAWRGGRNTLHKRLMADGYTRRNRNGDIVPSQKAVKLGVLRVRESHRPASDGGVHTDLTTMVTGKGQRYFVDRYARAVAL